MNLHFYIVWLLSRSFKTTFLHFLNLLKKSLSLLNPLCQGLYFLDHISHSLFNNHQIFDLSLNYYVLSFCFIRKNTCKLLSSNMITECLSFNMDVIFWDFYLEFLFELHIAQILPFHHWVEAFDKVLFGWLTDSNLLLFPKKLFVLYPLIFVAF